VRQPGGDEKAELGPAGLNCPALSSVIRGGSGNPALRGIQRRWRAAAERGRNIRLQFLLRM